MQPRVPGHKAGGGFEETVEALPPRPPIAPATSQSAGGRGSRGAPAWRLRIAERAGIERRSGITTGSKLRTPRRGANRLCDADHAVRAAHELGFERLIDAKLPIGADPPMESGDAGDLRQVGEQQRARLVVVGGGGRRLIAARRRAGRAPRE